MQRYHHHRLRLAVVSLQLTQVPLSLTVLTLETPQSVAFSAAQGLFVGLFTVYTGRVAVVDAVGVNWQGPSSSIRILAVRLAATSYSATRNHQHR